MIIEIIRLFWIFSIFSDKFFEFSKIKSEIICMKFKSCFSLVSHPSSAGNSWFSKTASFPKSRRTGSSIVLCCFPSWGMVQCFFIKVPVWAYKKTGTGLLRCQPYAPQYSVVMQSARCRDQPKSPDSSGTSVVPIKATPPPAISCFIPWDFAPGLSFP